MSLGASRFSDRSSGEWFALWSSDQESMLATRIRNLAADIDAGYSPTGVSVRNQLADIADALNSVLAQYTRLGNMTIDKRGRWCSDDMKRRGVIE